MANSWKKYGGIYKSDKYNSIGVGTMVADQVLIRQRVITNSQVAGSLFVGENINVDLDIIVGHNATVSGELIVSSKSRFKDKIMFNETDDVSDNYISFINGNAKLGRLGIGTSTPHSFLDINVSNSAVNSGLGGSTVGNTVTDVLTIRNSNNKIRNIIAQNVHNSGVVVDTIGNVASIGFYKGDVSNNTATPIISISANTSTSNLSFNSNVNNILSNNTNNLTSLGNTNITSTNTTHILSNNVTNITSDINTIVASNKDISIDARSNITMNAIGNITITSNSLSKINSIVSLSNRTANDPLLNSTITIYDNSAETFLVDYYQQNTVKAGKAVTIVSSDTSSNAFINIVTPNQNGLSIGGGAYPYNTSRSMGVIGLMSTDASYLPVHVLVTNNTSDKHKISVGINTFSPETTKYVMDINGPTRIGNGEMHIRKRALFEQSSIHFSKVNANFGAVTGPPYIIDNSAYRYDILITYDGGVNWRTVSDIITSAIITTAAYDTLDVYSISQNEFLFIGRQASARLGHVIVDKNTPANNTFFRSDFNSPPYTFNSIYAYKDTNYNILIGGTYTYLSNPTKSVIYYYKVSAINSSNINATNLASHFIDASCTLITHCDGSGNNAYFVGNGIERIDFNSTIPVSLSYKSTGSYNKVYVYDANYVVAVGNKISYTRNGGMNWTDITNIDAYNTSYPYTNFGTDINIVSFNITGVVLVDQLNGIANGTFTDNNGIIRPLMIYTKDGSVSWRRVDPKVFYSSGVGHYIENNNLSCIVPSSTDNYVIVNNITTSSSSPFSSGSSNIIYGYLPNIFNVYSNQVVDVNGGMNVDGKIWQF
jgi:hypothetical protein